jgi:hypothetical protein
MNVLVQNQTTKKFGPFFDKSAKCSAPDFLGPTQFFRPLLCFAAEISALGNTAKLQSKPFGNKGEGFTWKWLPILPASNLQYFLSYHSFNLFLK